LRGSRDQQRNQFAQIEAGDASKRGGGDPLESIYGFRVPCGTEVDNGFDQFGLAGEQAKKGFMAMLHGAKNIDIQGRRVTGRKRQVPDFAESIFNRSEHCLHSSTGLSQCGIDQGCVGDVVGELGSRVAMKRLACGIG
jgi:hypothetical protein